MTTANTSVNGATQQPFTRDRQQLLVRHKIFIEEMVRHGQQRRAYMAAYPGCSAATADSCASRLMDKSIVREMIERGRERINLIRQRILEENIEEHIGEIESKRKVLKQIYRGGPQKRYLNQNGSQVDVAKICEDPMVRLAAIKQDNVLAKEMVAILCERAAVPGPAEALHNTLAANRYNNEK
jgi:hypothetical protein